MIEVITPHWPAPKQIRAFSTTRIGGTSLAPFDSLNLAEQPDDQPHAVQRNRALLREQMGLPNEPIWLIQDHTTRVIQADNALDRHADAAFTRQTGIVCTVMTADCLPILLCDRQATQVAAIHAGWRGLAAGIIEETLKTFVAKGEEIMAWLGPAIGKNAFEVGQEVVDLFLQADPHAMAAFTRNSNDRWLADLCMLAKQRLAHHDVTNVYGGDYCTYSDPQRFFSYRRDGAQRGCMASMIWMQDHHG